LKAALHECGAKGALLIASMVCDREDFRLAISGPRARPDPEQEAQYWERYRTAQDKKIYLCAVGNEYKGFFSIDNINHATATAQAHVHFWERTWSLPLLWRQLAVLCVGVHGLKGLYGMTPADNKKALDFATHVGFKRCGVWPNYFMGINAKPVDCIFTYLDLAKVT